MDINVIYSVKQKPVCGYKWRFLFGMNITNFIVASSGHTYLLIVGGVTASHSTEPKLGVTCFETGGPAEQHLQFQLLCLWQ